MDALPPIVVTQGDPHGVGPELLLHLGAAGHLQGEDRVFADPDRLRMVAAAVGTPWAEAGLAAVLPRIDPGVRVGAGQFEALRAAVDLVLRDRGVALVTAPIDKAIAQAEGLPTPGHTEYLAARAGTEDVAMCMAGPRLRVVLATIHVPLREVATRLTPEAIVRAGRLLAAALSRQAAERPRLAVLGLNPHAGERGLLGDEEVRVVAPAIAQLRQMFPDCEFAGPLAADTAMPAAADGRFDGVVAMYHDQGLAPFKLLHFYDGVNVTLGLPFVRTSPDHGTARDIAGRGVVDPRSMFAAVRMARAGGL